jgi:hypothetical protein
MAQVPQTGGQARYSSGLYAWLVEREELAATRKGFTLPWSAEQPSYTGLPDRLATLRAGCAINLAVCELPRHARAGLDTHWWCRAVVSPDGSIALSVDQGEWLAEEGL